MRTKEAMLLVSALALITVISYSSSRLGAIVKNYSQEGIMHEKVLEYKPLNATGESSELNQNIASLKEVYPDVVGWLSIPGTNIDYPFAKGSDNDYYLHQDLDKNWSLAGTIFMDYRNDSSFSDFSTLIFGHNMKNGSMFGTIKAFDDEAFFRRNNTGTIFLLDKTYEVEFIAFIVTKANDEIIYNSESIKSDADKEEFLDYIKSSARYYKDTNLSVEDTFITISTCNYEFNNARMVLVGKIKEI